ncbi:MAG: Nif3-like dinuclear metal center hexameric protein, partial [Bacteroidota bacterium]
MLKITKDFDAMHTLSVTISMTLWILFFQTSDLYAQSFTAGEVVDRIQSEVTCEWTKETVDTFKSGDSGDEITGIATTFLATLEVLKQAKAQGLNMIITHEPTFYNHLDETEHLEGDKVFAAKQQFIEDNKMIVWRFH